ncbi:signal peptidase I [Chloroherpeton thalassium]|uniref:signal peptidase I n=1 Tax=Chloroherpeton thalassium TaxID=100716 RepID=UPI001FE0CBA5|nr:signal peptidase I [Chloroherpeton thalassium]
MNKKSKSSDILKNEKATTKNSAREWAEALIFAAIAAAIIRSFIIEAYRIPTGSMENTLLAGDFLFVNKFVYGARIPFLGWRLPEFKEVENGDIVVFKFPKDPEVNYIKRCIAVAGQTLEIKNKEVFVDGKIQPFPPEGKFIGDTMPPGHPDINIFPTFSSFNKDYYGPIKIPKRGDNVTLNAASFYTYKDVLEYEGHSVSLMGNQVIVDGAPMATYEVKQNYYFMMGDNRDNSLDGRYWGFMPESNLVGSALIIFWSWNPDISLLNPIDKISSIRWGRLGSLIH